MMMHGMAGGMYVALVLSAALLSGFAYIVWVLSSKEKDNTKLIGQIISAVIAVIVVIMLVGGIYSGATGKGCAMSGKGMMMEKGMMGGSMDKSKMMEMMMKDPEMKKMMMKCMEQMSK